LISGEFMPMDRFLVPGLAFAAMLTGSAIDAAWRYGPRRRTGVGLVAVGLAVLGALPGIEPSAEDPIPDDAGIHLVPRTVRESLRFRFLMHDRRFTSDLKTWEAMGTRVRYWSRTGAAMAEVLPPEASVIKGGIGALGYYSRLTIHDLYGLVSPEVHAHRVRDTSSSKGPGHDVFVKPRFFLRKEPTVFRHKLIHGPNLDGKVRATVKKWRPSSKVKQTYAPVIYRMEGVDPDAPGEILLLLERITPPTTGDEAWKRYERQARELTFARAGVPRGDARWAGHPQPERSPPAAAGSHPNVLILI